MIGILIYPTPGRRVLAWPVVFESHGFRILGWVVGKRNNYWSFILKLLYIFESY